MFKKIVFMGTPEFSVPILKSLYQNGYPISAVYCQPPKASNRGQQVNKSEVQKFSENITLTVRTPKNLKNNLEELNYFKNLNPDIAIVVAYGQLIPKEFLKIPKHGFINIHASLLPKWRGAAPIQRCIMNRDKITGISVMKLEESLDTGPILLKKEIELDNKLNSEKLANKLSRMGSEVILDCLDLIESGKTKFINQNHDNATYAKKILKEESKIDWKKNAEDIIAKINGLYPNPSAHFSFNGERFKVIEVDFVNLSGNPGLVLDNKLTIGCGSNSLRILQIQRQGKNVQKVGDFLIGSKIKKGTILS